MSDYFFSVFQLERRNGYVAILNFDFIDREKEAEIKTKLEIIFCIAKGRLKL